MTNPNRSKDEGFESLRTHRDFLLRYARARVQEPALAEDAVQETLIAALDHRDRFQGRAKLRTWLTAILRNKIIDLVRTRRRALPDDALALGEDADVDAMFDVKGEWVDPPADWGRPDAALESNQFWEVYRSCSRALPERDALVFAMSEELNLSSEEICKEMRISTSNLHVILYRARQKMRSCLSNNWFGTRDR